MWTTSSETGRALRVRVGEDVHLCVVNDGGEPGRALRVGTGEDVHLCVVNDVVLNSGCNGSTTQCGLLVKAPTFVWWTTVVKQDALCA